MTEPGPAELQAMVPMATTLGIELLEAGPGQVVARMGWAPERCTVGGVMHGGALMSLADTAGAICAFLDLPEGAVGTATIESKTNLLRAVREGSVTARSRPLHHGSTLAVIETELRDDRERLVAKTAQTQIYQYPRDRSAG
ncbi:MAG TPA: PaaI family thioesterase [Solirubrobacterales bacterium]|nr:PaaI family thioesterase [Solirubrobacterales bacterium]